MVHSTQITLGPFARGAHLVTKQVMQNLPQLPDQGLINFFIQHTSAAITINENADPTVRVDLAKSLDELVRENEPFYTHVVEGPDDMPAHIKSSLLGASVTVPIIQGKLALGTWQGLYLCEFRNDAPTRKLIATIYS